MPKAPPLAVMRSGFPSPLMSAAVTADTPRIPMLLEKANPPLPLLVKISTATDWYSLARSTLPSPLKSAAATELGREVDREALSVNTPLPLLVKIVMALPVVEAQTTSRLLSPLRSARARDDGDPDGSVLLEHNTNPPLPLLVRT